MISKEYTAECQTFGCHHRVEQHFRYCCRLCFEAQQDQYPVDEHTPECHLRQAILEDPVVAKWAAIYEQLSRRGPAFEETWRHLQHSFYGTDVGLPDRSQWDIICVQLRKMRDTDSAWVEVIGCPGLLINLTTGATNNVGEDFRVEFP